MLDTIFHFFHCRATTALRGSKGSAVKIAEAYRMKRLEEERLLHSESKQKARMAKMLNSASSSATSRDHSRQQRKLSPSPVSQL